MKKLIAIIITFIFIYENVGYSFADNLSNKSSLRIPIGIRSIDMGEIEKAEAIQEIRDRIDKIKATNPPVTVDYLFEIIAKLEGPSEKEAIEEYKKMQTSYLGAMIEGNQYLIELFDILLKLDGEKQSEVIHELKDELHSLYDWVKKYRILIGGVGHWGFSTMVLLNVWNSSKQLNIETLIKYLQEGEALEIYRWTTAKFNAPCPIFKIGDKKACLERIEIEARSMKHDPWNNLPDHLYSLESIMLKMPEAIRADNITLYKIGGISHRIFLLSEARTNKVFYEYELFNFVECLRIIESLDKYIEEHIDTSYLNENEQRYYLKIRQTTFEIIHDALSVIEGHVPESCKSRFSLKEAIEEAFNISVSEYWVQKGRASLEVTGIEPDEMYNDHRKVINIFRLLFIGSKQVWLERGGGTDNTQPLRLNVDFKFEREKSILEIEVFDNAGGVHDQKDWDLFNDSDDPERQIAFLLNQSRRKGDTGLGLAEVWWLVKLLGGKIKFQNIVEGEIVKGARFIIELPDAITSSIGGIPGKNDASTTSL